MSLPPPLTVSLLDVVKPPERLSKREIRVLALLAIVAFSQGWAGNVLTHTLALTRETFGLSDGGVAGLQATVRAVALLALVFSWWGDRHGRRKPLLLAFFVIPAANIVTAIAPSLTAFTLSQATARIGTIALSALALVVLAEEIGPAVRAYAAGIFALFLSMGTGFSLIVSRFGDLSPEAWRWLFAASGIPLMVLPFLVINISESRAFEKDAERPPLRSVITGPTAKFFWAIAGLSFALSAFTGPGANFILLRLNDLGWNQAGASNLLLGTSTPAVAIGLLVGGKAADIIGRRPTEMVSILVGVAGALLFFFTDTAWVGGIGLFLSVGGASAFSPALSAQRSELFPTGIRATAGAWVVNAAIFGGLFGFSIGRLVIDSIGVPVTMAVLGGILIAASSLIWVMPETKGTHLVDPDDIDPAIGMPA
ncbi:MFS transporter [bacterium]|nr:MFS transporter [bacterium]